MGCLKAQLPGQCWVAEPVGVQSCGSTELWVVALSGCGWACWGGWMVLVVVSNLNESVIPHSVQNPKLDFNADMP